MRVYRLLPDSFLSLDRQKYVLELLRNKEIV